MKSIASISLKILNSLLLITVTFTSCEYQEVADAPYPEQTIYMPAALRGIYDVSVEYNTYGVPTTGNQSRYVIEGNNFNVPLGVYRAGANNDGGFNVNITANTDTINLLVADGTLAGVEILPSDQFTLPTSINVKDGEEIAVFNLSVQLGFLQANPGTQYAIGVSISSAERKVNTDFSTTVVLIDADLAQ
jgi:hypothetical protein